MKNTVTKLALIFTAASALFLGACDVNGNIYNMIDEEVKAEECGITGNILSLVPFTLADGTTRLFTSNGNIYSRDITTQSTDDEDSWNENWGNKIIPSAILSTENGTLYTAESAEKFSDNGGRFLYLASDANYIYAMSMIWYQNTSGENAVWEKDVWYSADGTSWNPVDLSSFSSEIYEHTTNATNEVAATYSASDIGLIFCNKSRTAANRHAYIKLCTSSDSTYSVYLLNGASLGSEVTSNGANSATLSCTDFNGTDYFCDGQDIENNGTYMYYCGTTNSTSSSYKSKYLYYANGYSGSAFTLDGGDAGSVTPCSYITSLGVCNECILVGTTTGIYEVALTDGIPASSYSTITTNASSIFTSSYEVYPIYVRDPEKDSTEGDIFAAMDIMGTLSSSSHGLFEESGLYAYYPSRGYWNKDGTSDSSSNGN